VTTITNDFVSLHYEQNVPKQWSFLFRSYRECHT